MYIQKIIAFGHIAAVFDSYIKVTLNKTNDIDT